MMVGSPCHPPSADPFRCPLPATNPPWRPLRRRAPWGAAPSCQPTHRPGSRPVVWAACMARNDLRDWEMSTNIANRIQKISKTQRPLTDLNTWTSDNGPQENCTCICKLYLHFRCKFKRLIDPCSKPTPDIWRVMSACASRIPTLED